jgi:hypothetical protein
MEKKNCSIVRFILAINQLSAMESSAEYQLAQCLHSGNNPDLNIVSCVAGRNGRTAHHSTCYKEKHNGKDHEAYTETKIRELVREFRWKGGGHYTKCIYVSE